MLPMGCSEALLSAAVVMRVCGAHPEDDLLPICAHPVFCCRAAWRPEGEGITRLDLVEEGDRLAVKEMEQVRLLPLLPAPAASAVCACCLPATTSHSPGHPVCHSSS